MRNGCYFRDLGPYGVGLEAILAVEASKVPTKRLVPAFVSDLIRLAQVQGAPVQLEMTNSIDIITQQLVLRKLEEPFFKLEDFIDLFARDSGGVREV